MNHSLRSSALALLLLISPLLPARAADPAPAQGPFTVAGTVQGVSLQQVASNLDSVTSITNAGDSRLFLTLRPGRIVVLENGGVKPQPFLDIHGLTTNDGERGLLSVAFHPRYAQNGLFFIDYTNLQGNTVIARYQVSASDPGQADPASARILLTIAQPYSNHNGGQLQFGPDGDLYIGMGDGGSGYDPECRAQDPSMLLGKMLRIDVDQNVATPPYYGIPASNPFRGAGDPPGEVWASGLRNPWRFSFDRETGDLWIGDVGQDQHEEIDFQPASSRGGENYGWKIMEGTFCSSRIACPASTPPCGSSAYTLPVLEYSHQSRCSVIGGYVYRGNAVSQLRGDYVFGDLCSGEILAAARSGEGFTVRTVPGQIPQLTTFGEDHDGELYAASLTGQLYRFTGTAAGGGKETVGLFDPQGSLFELKNANSANAGVKVVRFGPRNRGWIPLAGDWDGNGKTTFGLYDPATATFRLKNSTPGGGSDVILQVDSPSSRALPLVGDWNGDGKDTVGLYDPATGTFYLKNSLSGPGFDIVFPLGPRNPNLIPLAGDWNGDGVDGVGVYDPVRSEFLLSNGLGGGIQPALQFQFGPPGRGSLPVIGDWNGDGKDDVGVYDPASAVFRLRNSLSAGNPDAQFRFGPRRQGWKPIAGSW
jgi:glucose/arabinose dehydrogenase